MWRHTWGVGLYMTLWDCSAIAAIRIVTTEPLTPRTANLDTEKHATQIQIQIGTQYKKIENISQVTLNMKHSNNLSYLALLTLLTPILRFHIKDEDANQQNRT